MTVVLGPRNALEPDLFVVREEAVRSRRQTSFEAADVLLVVEVVSPDSEARDRDTKPRKYAAAGIPHFWLVEMAGDEDHPVVHTYERDPVTQVYRPHRHPPRAAQADGPVCPGHRPHVGPALSRGARHYGSAIVTVWRRRLSRFHGTHVTSSPSWRKSAASASGSTCLSIGQYVEQLARQQPTEAQRAERLAADRAALRALTGCDMSDEQFDRAPDVLANIYRMAAEKVRGGRVDTASSSWTPVP